MLMFPRSTFLNRDPIEGRFYFPKIFPGLLLDPSLSELDWQSQSTNHCPSLTLGSGSALMWCGEAAKKLFCFPHWEVRKEQKNNGSPGASQKSQKGIKEGLGWKASSSQEKGERTGGWITKMDLPLESWLHLKIVCAIGCHQTQQSHSCRCSAIN